jgi:hypothetical protein
VLILAGATVGATLLHVHPGYGVLLTALLTTSVALTGGIARHRILDGDPAIGESATVASHR